MSNFEQKLQLLTAFMYLAAALIALVDTVLKLM